MSPKVEVEKSPIGCTVTNPDPKDFNNWCKAHDVLWPKCRTGMSASTGRCVLACKDIAAGEVVVEVPDAMVLMAENCAIQELLEADGLTKPADDALLEVQGLVLALMYEKALGSKSLWGPYLSFLPSDLSHMIIFWEDSELAELAGTAAHDKLLGRVQHAADAPTRVRQLFEELVVPFVCGHEGVASVLLGGSKATGAALQEETQQKLWQPYLWATGAVASYSFVLGDEHYQGMVAVWDLLNHITGAVNVRLHHDADKGVLQMIATEDIPKGSEVVNCYGHLSNAELLRGYGYVEQHNSIKHVQVPAHFCIKAAAAAAAAAAVTPPAAAGKKGRKASAAAVGGCGSNKGQDSPESDADEDLQPSDEGEQGSGSSSGDDDGADSSSEDESSSEGSEPDWDLEDDEPEALQQQQQRLQQYWAQQQQQQPPNDDPAEGSRARKKQKRDSRSHKQQQQQQGKVTANGVQTAAPCIPSLAEAQGQISDWEERWQLCFSLGLLPKNGVVQVPAGGLDSCPGQLLAILLLLVGEAEGCAALAAAAAAATKAAAAAQAAAAAAVATADKASKGGKGGKASKKDQKGSKQQQQQEVQQEGRSKRGRSGESAADAGQQGLNAAEASLAAGVKADLDQLQFTRPALLASALQHLVLLMQSRYSCSLQQDQLLLQGRSSLAPRLAAAVTARSGEKEVWEELQQVLQVVGVGEKVMSQARQALQHAVLTTAQQAAAAKARRRKEPAHDCCGKPGCTHEHHEHGSDESHEHHAHGSGDGHEHDADAAAAAGKSGRGKSSKSKGASAAEDFAFNFEL